PGMPVRQAVHRRQARVREIMHTLPHAAQVAIRESMTENDDTQVMSYNLPTAPIPGGANDTTVRHNTTNG
ncbi:ABC transporter ATP-binding protein, partial [Nocardia nova]|nr:ABC transporter ATP-binding protein [Nocardia nova]